MSHRVRIEQALGLARVVLARPEARNAFDAQLIAELTAAFAAVGKDEGVRVVELAGDGKTFCAGADVEWMRASIALTEAENRADAERASAMLRTIDECPKPVVGRVQGAALGGGVGLVACCDIVVAATDATFALSETRLGILPAMIGPYVLAKIGMAQARRWTLTAERFDAPTARAIGLIHEVVPPEGLDAKVAEIVGALRACGPRAVAEAKAYLRAIAPMPRADAVKHAVATIARVRTGPEAQEGLKAFLEKRKPAWGV